MALWPALDIRQDAPGGVPPLTADLLLAALDDFEPTAVEDQAAGIRVYFSSRDERDAARASLTSNPLADALEIRTIDVPDEDWARRSQANLAPVRIGRITIFPTSESRAAAAAGVIALVVPPSMGFGTGHHATTRLCLWALQTFDLRGASVLDVGTGSGVLAIAASRLGAQSILGIDNDPHALAAARETLALNPEAQGVAFETVDLTRTILPPSDVVTANLTGALLVRAAGTLMAAVKPGGTLVLSGLLADERTDVQAAFHGLRTVAQREEDGWVALLMK